MALASGNGPCKLQFSTGSWRQDGSMVGQYGTLVVTRVLPMVQWRMGPLNKRKVVFILEIHPFSTSMIRGRKSILREMWDFILGGKHGDDHGVELVWSLYTTFSVLFFWKDLLGVVHKCSPNQPVCIICTVVTSLESWCTKNMSWTSESVLLT